jgi:CheY-like chemotaxis protein
MQDLGKTILVVDDEAVVRDLVANFLTKLGYKVVEATDGTEALVVYDQLEQPPAVLVTDIVMPKLGGVQLAEILRERQADLRVLFVSSYPDKKLGDGEMANPRSRYLAKPFSLRNFAAAISNLLQVEPRTERAG